MLTSLLARIAPKLIVLTLASLALPVFAHAVAPVSGRGLDRSFAGGSALLPLPTVDKDETANLCVPRPGGGAIVTAISGKYIVDPDDASFPYVRAKHNSIYAFNGAGKLVRGFGRGGVLRAGTGRMNSPRQIEVDARGRIYALYVQERLSKTTSRVELRRLTARGRRDPRFGRRGRVTIVTPRTYNAGMVRLSRGRIGIFATSGSRNVNETVVHVLLPNGSHDHSFGRNGIASVPISADSATALRGGEWVLAGTQWDALAEKTYVAVRVISRDGTPLTSWGSGGGFTLTDPPPPVAKSIAKTIGEKRFLEGSDYMEVAGIAAGQDGGFSVALQSGYSNERSVRWVANVSRRGAAINPKGSLFFGDSSGLSGGTDAEYTTHWSLPGTRGDWVNVSFEYTGSAAIWASRVSKSGRRTRTDSRSTNMISDTELSSVSLTPDGRELIGCGLAKLTREPGVRGFVFKMRIK